MNRDIDDDDWDRLGEHPEDGVVAVSLNYYQLTNREIRVWGEVEEGASYGDPSPEDNYAVEYVDEDGELYGWFFETKPGADACVTLLLNGYNPAEM